MQSTSPSPPPSTSPSPSPSTSTDHSPSLPPSCLAGQPLFFFFLCEKIAVYIPGMSLSKRPDLLSPLCCNSSPLLLLCRLRCLPLLPFPAESGELVLELLDYLKETNCARLNCMQHSACHTLYISLYVTVSGKRVHSAHARSTAIVPTCPVQSRST